ncbi:reverse transcriptase domain-containing protein [Tanacetum coccineum]
MLLGRTTMHKMGIVVSTIHGAIKFHTAKGIGTVFSAYEYNKIKEGMKKLLEHFKERLRDLLRSNADVFAWTHADMTMIPRTIMIKGKSFKTEYKLNEYSHIKPIKQKKQSLGPNRNIAACKEVDELTKIQMEERDKDKTAFFTGEGVFCYQKMPFGLKNARATYQRLVDKVFHDQIERNLEAYVDDMVIKITSKEDMLADIKETLESTDTGRRSNNDPLNFDKEHKRIFICIKERRTARRLRRYFQAHIVTVQTNSPIKQGLTKPEKSRRVAKWAIELGKHDIVFQKRGDDKKEMPKDFFIEVPLEDSGKEAEGRTDTKSENTKLSCKWKLYTDGAASSDRSSTGLMMIDPEG